MKIAFLIRTDLLVLLLVGVGYFSGCAGSASDRVWYAELQQADRLVDDRLYEEALGAYDLLFATAPTEHYVRYITYRRGFVEEQRDNFDAAIRQYGLLLEDAPAFAEDDEFTPRGLFRMGLILYDELGRIEEAVEIWKLVIHYYPNMEGQPHRALDAIVVHFENTGAHEEAVEYFSTEFPHLEQTRMGDNMLYWLGYWYRHHLGDSEAAYKVFEMLRNLYFQTGGVREEGEWEMVEILHEWGEYHLELNLLDSMRSGRTESLIFATMVTEIQEDAGYRMGFVRFENLNDPEGAIQNFREFIDTWIRSLRRDNAGYQICLITASIGDSARTRRECEAFIVEYPESRFVDEVEALLADLDGDP